MFQWLIRYCFKPYDSSSDHLIPAIYELIDFRKSAKQRKQKVQSDISQAA
jgi:hypothetical protein